MAGIYINQGGKAVAVAGVSASVAKSPEDAFDPSVYNLPILALTGDTSAMTKDNAVTLDYEYGDRSGSCTVKWQGNSSLAYPKKNYTIKFDNAFEAAAGWGEQMKYCLKANFIDHSHARNLVSAKLWGQIVKRRKNVNNFSYDEVTGLLDGHLGINRTAGYMYLQADETVQINATMYAIGEQLWTGQTFPAGTYRISYDIYNPNGADTDPDPCVYTGFGIVGSFKTAVAKPTAYQDWVHMETTVTNENDGGMLILQAAGCATLKSDAGYKFRNIRVVRTDVWSNDHVLELPNGGAVDGFPIVITLNGQFHGLYTFNIPKDGWMFGMSDTTLQQAIVCADVPSNPTCEFFAPATLDGDFELEYVADEENTDWVVTSLNQAISACVNSDGTDLDTVVSQYVDLESAVDYLIFTALIGGVDMYAHNYLLATYDGVKWFFSPYDMDTTYGIDWDGARFYRPTVYPLVSDFGHRVMQLLIANKPDMIRERYQKLRNGVLSEANVTCLFDNFVCAIPRLVYEEDLKTWPTIPSSAVSNVQQIENWYRMRTQFMDKDIENL